jgi:hypothetical protein
MTALDLLNVGLQTVLLGSAGWLLVCLFLKDARHRALASLMTLAAMVLLPWMPHWQGAYSSSEAQEASPWRPEWKVTVSEPVPAPVLSQGAERTMDPATWNFPHWTGLLVWIWCGGSAWMALRHLWRTAAVTRWKQQLPLHEWKGTQVRVTRDFPSPCLAGVIMPEIVIPERALQEWSAQQWHWALSHEREHQRGADPLIAWCLEWIRASLWWNPLVHRLVADWEQAREEICDRAAVEKAPEAAPYSEFLLSVAAAARSPGVPMAASRSARRLKARLLALLEHRPVRRRPHWAFLLLIAGLSVGGTNLVGCVSLKSSPVAKDEGPLITRSLKVAPDVISRIREAGPADSSAANRAVRSKSVVSVQQGLQNHGVDFPNGASAEFDPAASQLIVTNNPRRLQQVETLVNALRTKVDFENTIILINTKWIEVPSDAPLVSDLSVLTEVQFQRVLRSLNQRRGADLLTAPQIAMLSAQRATMEVIRKQMMPAGRDFSGVLHEFVPMIHENKILLNFVADIGTPFRGGKRMGLMAPTNTGAITIKHLIRRESVPVGNGETLAVDMGEISKGRRIMLFMTALLIDRDGKKLSMEEVMRERTKAPVVPSGRRERR